MKHPSTSVLILLSLILLQSPLLAEADMLRLKSKGFLIPESRTEAPLISVLPENEAEKNNPDRIFLPTGGKVTLLNVWACWCPPCRAEIPSLQRLGESFQNTDFQLAPINLNEEISQVRDFLNENSLNIPVFYFPDGDALNAYKLNGIPASYLIDKKGRVAAVHIGGADWDDPAIYRTIRELLEE